MVSPLYPIQNTDGTHIVNLNRITLLCLIGALVGEVRRFNLELGGFLLRHDGDGKQGASKPAEVHFRAVECWAGMDLPIL